MNDLTPNGLICDSIAAGGIKMKRSGSVAADNVAGMVRVNAHDNHHGDWASLEMDPAAARHLADVLNRAADEAERGKWEGGGNHNQEESA